MLYNIEIRERGSYREVKLSNYTLDMLVRLMDVLMEDDGVDVTVSPFLPKKEEPVETDCPSGEPKGEEECW